MRKIFIALLMVLVVGFSGSAFGGGGPNPGGTCSILYEQPELLQGRAGKNISGTYTAWEIEDGVAVHVMLIKDKVGHAFEFTTFLGAGICDPNLTDEELLMRMSDWPCMMDIQQDFFPSDEWTNYFPLLVDVTIKARDCTPSPAEANYSSPRAISGDVMLKLVPLQY
jgi:hypothetical protein